MAPPTNEELANRRRFILQALSVLDPQGTTPAVLRDLIIDMGVRHQDIGGAIIQASMARSLTGPQPQQGRGQHGQAQPGQGQGAGGQSTGGRGQQSGTGTGRGAGASAGRGSSGQQ